MCAIVRGFFAAEGRTALRARSVVASFLWMVELLRLRDRSWVCCRGLVAQSYMIACGSDVCVRNPRIIAPKLGSEVCAAKS